MSPKPRRQGPAAPIDDPDYRALKALVIERTGHHYYADKDDQLWERLAGRIEASGCGHCGEYRRLLESRRGAAEWRRLESAVTINETFFFRFAEQFDLLRRILLPALIARSAETRRLRIWSVGCSTGAEPYSIAILLHELLGPALADWRISITGTDIDEAALRTAREARYGSWTLRTLGAEERARLFDEEDGQYRLKARYRGLVRFEHHNLMSLLDGAAPLQFTDYDLIVCRNVLIYFRHDVATRLVGALASRLDRQGYLLVGHAEPSPEFAEVATPVEIGGIRAYRRLGLAEAPQARPAPALPPPAPVHRPPRRPAARPVARAPRAPVAPVGEGPAPVERGAASAPRDPIPHYLAALGALALGHTDQAEEGFRRALYLDNRFAMAHYLLGRQLLAQGRVEDGRRSLANALRAVAALDPEAELPEGDGMTAGRLARAVRSALA